MVMMEEESKKRRRKANLQKLILQTVGTVGLLGVAVVAPNVIAESLKI